MYDSMVFFWKSFLKYFLNSTHMKVLDTAFHVNSIKVRRFYIKVVYIKHNRCHFYIFIANVWESDRQVTNFPLGFNPFRNKLKAAFQAGFALSSGACGAGFRWTFQKRRYPAHRLMCDACSKLCRCRDDFLTAGNNSFGNMLAFKIWSAIFNFMLAM